MRRTYKNAFLHVFLVYDPDVVDVVAMAIWVQTGGGERDERGER